MIRKFLSFPGVYANFRVVTFSQKSLMRTPQNQGIVMIQTTFRLTRQEEKGYNICCSFFSVLLLVSGLFLNESIDGADTTASGNRAQELDQNTKLKNIVDERRSQLTTTLFRPLITFTSQVIAY
ncbi:unnamed protein product [Schistosoma intercalatum]|nr:unnamed protein product [Schistosoma intercalatum]